MMDCELDSQTGGRRLSQGETVRPGTVTVTASSWAEPDGLTRAQP